MKRKRKLCMKSQNNQYFLLCIILAINKMRVIFYLFISSMLISLCRRSMLLNSCLCINWVINIYFVHFGCKAFVVYSTLVNNLAKVFALRSIYKHLGKKKLPWYMNRKWNMHNFLVIIFFFAALENSTKFGKDASKNVKQFRIDAIKCQC